MKIIIIAAGWATRLGKETIDIPKGLLKITKKSIIEMQLDLFQENHLSDITIITGPNKDKFKFKNVNYIQNKDSKNQEVLGSLMKSKSIMNDEVLTSYSDIIFDTSIFRSMLDFKGDIGIAVDLDWEKKYLNRTQHPKSEADNVLIENHRILKIKKNIKESKSTQNLGEFVGLMKLSKKGAKIFVGMSLSQSNSLVFMQNAGFANSLSTITSLVQLYQIPMIFLIGWRGFLKNDAPEHTKIGMIQPKLLQALSLQSRIINEKNWKVSCDWALKLIKEKKPCALILKRDFID